MFETFLRRLTGTAVPPPLDTPDASLALGALMVRIARADRHYAEAEKACIDRLLAHHYGLAPEAARKLRSEAEILESEAPDTVRFTRALKEAVAYDERAWVLEALWEVALADGQRDHEEDAVLRLAASLLGVRDRDSAIARQRVERRNGGNQERE